jgi:transcriptional regulator with XRE-family HTH domain
LESASPDFRKVVGERIRRHRHLVGLSQRDLARKMELSHQQIQKYEHGDSSLPLEKLLPLAELLRIRPLELLRPDEDWGAAEGVGLPSDQLELLRLYGALSKDHQRLLLRVLKSLG